MPFDVVIPDRSHVMAAHRTNGGLVAAVFPYHYPRPLLRAFGILPVEVWGPASRDTSLADAHVQGYTCALVRNGLALLLGGGLARVDLVLVPHGCDALQGLGSILRDFVRPEKPVLTLYTPRGERALDVTFLTAELAVLAGHLSRLTGRPLDEAALRAAIAAEAGAADLAARLWQRRAELPWSDSEFYRLLRAREYLPAEQFCRLTQQALTQVTAAAAAAAAAAAQQRRPIVLSGVVPAPDGILDAIWRAGAFVAADDTLACGRRAYPAVPAGEPLAGLAQALCHGPADSTRGSSVAARSTFLRGLVTASKARGVLFYPLKFCEPELFYIPQVRAELERDGIRTATIEGELAFEAPAQAITRVEAFVEGLL
jgi:benzoyl-CoA reductase/2-hydroxyglutaryl-CoA dehydratase subunit BcrC/BadD/HgdB